MSEDEIKLWLLALTLGVFIGFAIGATVATNGFESLATKHGAAHYDAITGKFTWNDEKPEKP